MRLGGGGKVEIGAVEVDDGVVEGAGVEEPGDVGDEEAGADAGDAAERHHARHHQAQDHAQHHTPLQMPQLRPPSTLDRTEVGGPH